MNIEQQANEIVANYQKEKLDELLEQAESWKKCGCHKCMIEHDRVIEKFYDDHILFYGKKHREDNRDFGINFDYGPEEIETELEDAEIIEITIPDDITEEELTKYFLSLKLKNTLVCFKYWGEELWIYYDKNGKPEEYGDRQ